MKYSESLRQVSNQLYDLLENHGTQIGVPDYGWENYVWQSDKFARAHLENYWTEKVSVIHCVIMPHTHTNAPIFGFDAIEINGNLTGMFLDVTPVDDTPPPTLPRVGEPRPIPEWGDFFSDEFVCCKPDLRDLMMGVYVLNYYLEYELPGIPTGDNAAGQQRYIDGQRRNPQTFRMLKSHVGEQRAREFMETMLFPTVKW
jgi:phycocyanobilin:ferredoxin oxidoreductase